MNKFDVIIIGAGIGGLTCGCYLAKVGLNVLIVEQQPKVGGYCSSFQRQGFKFDVGVHYFGSIKNGFLGHVLEELELKDKIVFRQFDPTDKIIMPENTTYIRANPQDTIEEFKRSFPSEKVNIDSFFNLILKNNLTILYKKLRLLTFKNLLDEFFRDYRLKSTIGVLLGNIGTAPSVASAFSSIVLFKQYLLDPGYYPDGGIQKLPDTLAENFNDSGGKIILSKRVDKITVTNKAAKGIILENGEEIKADIVVSNCDVTQTFKHLLGIDTKESQIIDKMKLAPSVFLVYLGLKNNLRKTLGNECNIYYFSTYEIDDAFLNFGENILEKDLKWIICNFPSLHYHNGCLNTTVSILTFANFKTKNFWQTHRKVITEKIINKANECMPNLENSIAFKIDATPITFSKYTSNREGSFVGWLSTLNQTRPTHLPQKTSIRGLYLTGHWCTMGYLPFGGIPRVAFSGRKVAELIFHKIGKKMAA